MTPTTRGAAYCGSRLSLLALIAFSPACHNSVPRELKINVELDGKPLQAIDADLLTRIAPEVSTDDVKAWALTSLLPGAAIEGKTAEVEDEESIRTAILGPDERPGDRKPVLEISGAGDVRVTLVPKDGPYPAFHPRDGAGRKRSVKVIRFYASEPPKKGDPVHIEVVVDGAEPKTMALASTNVKPLSLPSGDGSGQRDAWPLRDLSEAFARSKGAAVVEVIAKSGEHVSIEPAAWRDSSKLPVLRVNRHGRMKLQWLSKSLEPIDGAIMLKDVSEIRIENSRT
jgi:hypothetical protein